MTRTRVKKYLIGIDEAGRGPLAGPITVAAVALPTNYRLQITGYRLKLRDSKKLSPKKRELWFNFIKKQKIPFAVANVSSKIIDRINISNATNLAATRALHKLTTDYQLQTANIKILLDGGLKIIIPRKSVYSPRWSARTIVRGDEKIPVIALASIVAKVRRDKYMKKIHKKFSLYGFLNHKGYGTKRHYAALKKNGASPIHRKSFLRRY